MFQAECLKMWVVVIILQSCLMTQTTLTIQTTTSYIHPSNLKATEGKICVNNSSFTDKVAKALLTGIPMFNCLHLT